MASTIPAERYAHRRENLRRLLHERGLGGLLATLDANRFYLSGFELQDHQVNESSGCILILADGRDWLCTDSRYLDAAKRLWEADRILIYGGEAMADIGALYRAEGSGALGFESKCLPVHAYRALGEGIQLEAADGLVETLRIIKEPEEIQAMEASCALNHKLMDWLPTRLAPGRTEQDLAWDVERFFRENGAQSLAFPCITAVGPNAALPHAVPDMTPIVENCPVLVDVGCRMHDYCSDQTRTFWVGGRPTEAYLRTMEQVRTAQAKALEIIRPGVPVQDVYRAAMAHFEAAGVNKAFTHSLGHGIGLQTHEPPSLNPRWDTVLRPGMVVTVEPGLYYPEWGGVRWEYMVVVTEDGYLRL